MSITKLKRTAACFGLLAYLSISLGINGVVLCLGQDGHIQLESAAPDLTCRVSLPVPNTNPVLSDSDGVLDQCQCGPCDDIPLALTSPDAIVGIKPLQGEAVKTQLVSAAFSRLALRPGSAATPEGAHPRSSTRHFSLVSLRTVILLI